MGWRDWFAWSSSSKSNGDPPARQDRQKCWDSRDAYYACLDASNVLKPGEEGTACSKQLKEYEKNCAKSWIDYFNQRRVLAEQQKESLAMARAQAEEAKRKGRA